LFGQRGDAEFGRQRRLIDPWVGGFERELFHRLVAGSVGDRDLHGE